MWRTICIKYLSVLLLLINGICVAQRTKKGVVHFKVKAPLPTCTIESDEKFFQLEKESLVHITVTGKNQRIQVRVKGASVVSVKDNTYKLRFFAADTVTVSVYAIKPEGLRYIGKRSFNVVAPALYFCGLKIDSTAQSLRLGKCDLYAYSTYYKIKMPVSSFEMFYMENLNPDMKRKAQTVYLKSDSCKVSKEMKEKLVRFQPVKNRLYLYSIFFIGPDGIKRTIDPVELFAKSDTSKSYKAESYVTFSLKKKKGN